MSAVRVGVVGLGWWGQRVVDVLGPSTAVNVVAVTDPSAPARDALRARSCTVHETYDDLLADDAVEAVIITSPHDFHADQIVAAVRTGRHVFCEKPFTTNRADAERALDAARAAGIVVGIGHERRFEPAIKVLTEITRFGDLGLPMVFEGNFSQDKFLALPRDNWRLSPVLAPVGPLSATGIHLMDLAISLLGRPVQVTALLDTRLDHFANGASLTVQMEFLTGASAMLSAVLCTPFDGRVALYGSEGWVEIRDRTHPEAPSGWDVTTVRRGREPVHHFEPPAPIVCDNLETWAGAVRGTEKYPVSPDEILLNVATFEAITKSALTRRTVRVE
jgi:predicted dehydrogenase